ncbi:unnamed protein product [Rotaria sordida]|uniref:SSD domain-containing protein n=1 Tax=Rotaria sordida TaxID=392033 RepID=A0A814UI53_9BILA|nr:unnamed protein product [Rotaria sordida]CAF1429179.1 unnamed protein product [Rotaria sordida]
MTSICVVLLIYKRNEIHFEHLLKGFQAHGTKSSDEYRKLIALIRETQTTHLFPYPTDKKFQQTPYSSFNPHINPCSKRFYLSTCPILHYTELIFDFNNKSTTLFDDIDSFKSICKFEWILRMKFTNCSLTINESCCEFIGPVSLLFDGHFISLEQCENLTLNQLEDYHSKWLSCNSSLCSNYQLHHYLKYLQSSSTFKIFINIENNINKTENLLYLYNNLYNKQYNNQFYLIHINFDSYNEQFMFYYFLRTNLPLLCLTISFYILCLLLFIKNIFFILIIILHIYITILLSSIIYIYLFHFPLVILNCTSITLYLFIIFIDSFLWYTCWFVNNHRRDDCTINRIIENLLTQTFYYLVPKNLTAIIILVITYTNQIIVLQCFTVFSFLLITISFFISFTLYPISFIFILRHQSSIPTIEHFLHHFLIRIKNICFIDHTIPYLIVRFRAFWLILLTLISCIAFIIIFQWPKLQFNVCRITFDSLPFHMLNEKSITNIKTLDIDITYYMGSYWEVPHESIIPVNDIPILDYNSENKMTSKSTSTHTFEDTLGNNLASFIHFCSELKSLQRKQSIEYMINERKLSYKYFHQDTNSQILNNNSFYGSSIENKLNDTLLTINNIHCFGDLSPSNSINLSSNTKFSSIIIHNENKSIDCSYICLLNKTTYNPIECIKCLNSLYYNLYKYNDLFIIKNGLRFINDAPVPRYLLQTINYKWNILNNINNIYEWQLLYKILQTNFIEKFYSKIFLDMSFWWSSEIFSTYTIMEQLQQEKFFLFGIKFIIILILLSLFTGILGLYVTLTTLFNFITSIAILILFNYKLTIENMSYFTIVLIICSQYSILYSISYKLAPTFFFQRENRTIYSLKQLCTTLFYLTFSIIIICCPCLFSSLPYLSKSSIIFIISSLISLIYSTFFLQSILYYIGPIGQTCFFIPCHFKLICNSTLQVNNNNDLSLRNRLNNTRRHQRMSTSSYVPSSYFSHIFTGSTYFESEYSGINDTLTIGSRRRESSRSHQISHVVKRNSIITGELIELYTPRASLAPHGHHHHHHRYSRHSSVPRGVPTTGIARPLYVSPSISPYSQLSIHSQIPSRQRSPSSHICQPSRSPSPSPYSSARQSTITCSLRPCYSAPRLHVSHHRLQTNNMKQTDILIEETPILSSIEVKKSSIGIQRQDAISSIDDYEQISILPREQLSAETKRNMLKTTTMESGGTVWLKRSSSS